MDSEILFRQSVRQLVDIVFTDDMEYFDALPEEVDRELGTPMADLISKIDSSENRNLMEAARLVYEIAVELGNVVPEGLSKLIGDMNMARLRLVEESGS